MGLSDFTISWTHEAEDWLRYHRKDSEELGYTFNEDFIYTPSDEEKKAIENEIHVLSEIIEKFNKEMIKLQMNENYHTVMKIYFKFYGDFHLIFWYEPSFEASDFLIMDYRDKEIARVVFENIPSVDYSSEFEYE